MFTFDISKNVRELGQLYQGKKDNLHLKEPSYHMQRKQTTANKLGILQMFLLSMSHLPNHHASFFSLR
jgi:hypothetical protein